jgi:dCMP deaminase
MTISKEKALKFLKEADYKANLFSKDPKRKVGAIILEKDTFIQLSCGYNGLPRGLKETKKRWNKDNKQYYVIHAEQNAIIHAAKTNISVNDAILVCNRFPCHNCALSAVQAGIKTIVTIDPGNNVSKNWEKSFKISEEIFKELNIKIIKFDEKDIKLALHNT